MCVASQGAPPRPDSSALPVAVFVLKSNSLLDQSVTLSVASMPKSNDIADGGQAAVAAVSVPASRPEGRRSNRRPSPLIVNTSHPDGPFADWENWNWPVLEPKYHEQFRKEDEWLAGPEEAERLIQWLENVATENIKTKQIKQLTAYVWDATTPQERRKKIINTIIRQHGGDGRHVDKDTGEGWLYQNTVTAAIRHHNSRIISTLQLQGTNPQTDWIRFRGDARWKVMPAVQPSIPAEVAAGPAAAVEPSAVAAVAAQPLGPPGPPTNPKEPPVKDVRIKSEPQSSEEEEDDRKRRRRQRREARAPQLAIRDGNESKPPPCAPTEMLKSPPAASGKTRKSKTARSGKRNILRNGKKARGKKKRRQKAAVAADEAIVKKEEESEESRRRKKRRVEVRAQETDREERKDDTDREQVESGETSNVTPPASQCDWSGSVDAEQDADATADAEQEDAAQDAAQDADATADAKVEKKPGHPPPPPPPPLTPAACRSGGSAARDQSRSGGPVRLMPAPGYMALPQSMIIAAYVFFPGTPKREVVYMLEHSPAHVSVVLTPGQDEELSNLFTQLRGNRQVHRRGWDTLMDKKVAFETPSDSMHMLIHRGHCIFGADENERLHESVAMSKEVKGKRISFCCNLVKFGGSRSSDSGAAVAVGFISSPPEEENLDPEIINAIRDCILQHGMRFLMGTLPKDDNKEMRNMLSECGARMAFQQEFVHEAKLWHWPCYIIAIGNIEQEFIYVVIFFLHIQIIMYDPRERHPMGKSLHKGAAQSVTQSKLGVLQAFDVLEYRSPRI